jgi:hypothetical protein
MLKLLSLWLPVGAWFYCWKHWPPLIQGGSNDGALIWPFFMLYFAAGSVLLGRFVWSWFRG